MSLADEIRRKLEEISRLQNLGARDLRVDDPLAGMGISANPFRAAPYGSEPASGNSFGVGGLERFYIKASAADKFLEQHWQQIRDYAVRGDPSGYAQQLARPLYGLHSGQVLLRAGSIPFYNAGGSAAYRYSDLAQAQAMMEHARQMLNEAERARAELARVHHQQGRLFDFDLDPLGEMLIGLQRAIKPTLAQSQAFATPTSFLQRHLRDIGLKVAAGTPGMGLLDPGAAYDIIRGMQSQIAAVRLPSAAEAQRAVSEFLSRRDHGLPLDDLARRALNPSRRPEFAQSLGRLLAPLQDMIGNEAAFSGVVDHVRAAFEQRMARVDPSRVSDPKTLMKAVLEQAIGQGLKAYGADLGGANRLLEEFRRTGGLPGSTVVAGVGEVPLSIGLNAGVLSAATRLGDIAHAQPGVLAGAIAGGGYGAFAGEGRSRGLQGLLTLSSDLASYDHESARLSRAAQRYQRLYERAMARASAIVDSGEEGQEEEFDRAMRTAQEARARMEQASLRLQANRFGAGKLAEQMGGLQKSYAQATQAEREALLSGAYAPMSAGATRLGVGYAGGVLADLAGLQRQIDAATDPDQRARLMQAYQMRYRQFAALGSDLVDLHRDRSEGRLMQGELDRVVLGRVSGGGRFADQFAEAAEQAARLRREVAALHSEYERLLQQGRGEEARAKLAESKEREGQLVAVEERLGEQRQSLWYAAMSAAAGSGLAKGYTAYGTLGGEAAATRAVGAARRRLNLTIEALRQTADPAERAELERRLQEDAMALRAAQGQRMEVARQNMEAAAGSMAGSEYRVFVAGATGFHSRALRQAAEALRYAGRQEGWFVDQAAAHPSVENLLQAEAALGERSRQMEQFWAANLAQVGAHAAMAGAGAAPDAKSFEHLGVLSRGWREARGEWEALLAAHGSAAAAYAAQDGPHKYRRMLRARQMSLSAALQSYGASYEAHMGQMTGALGTLEFAGVPHTARRYYAAEFEQSYVGALKDVSEKTQARAKLLEEIIDLERQGKRASDAMYQKVAEYTSQIEASREAADQGLTRYGLNQRLVGATFAQHMGYYHYMHNVAMSGAAAMLGSVPGGYGSHLTGALNRELYSAGPWGTLWQGGVKDLFAGFGALVGTLRDLFGVGGAFGGGGLGGLLGGLGGLVRGRGAAPAGGSAPAAARGGGLRGGSLGVAAGSLGAAFALDALSPQEGALGVGMDVAADVLTGVSIGQATSWGLGRMLAGAVARGVVGGGPAAALAKRIPYIGWGITALATGAELWDTYKEYTSRDEKAREKGVQAAVQDLLGGNNVGKMLGLAAVGTVAGGGLTQLYNRLVGSGGEGSALMRGSLGKILKGGAEAVGGAALAALAAQYRVFSENIAGQSVPSYIEAEDAAIRTSALKGGVMGDHIAEYIGLASPGRAGDLFRYLGYTPVDFARIGGYLAPRTTRGGAGLTDAMAGVAFGLSRGLAREDAERLAISMAMVPYSRGQVERMMGAASAYVGISGQAALPGMEAFGRLLTKAVSEGLDYSKTAEYLQGSSQYIKNIADAAGSGAGLSRILASGQWLNTVEALGEQAQASLFDPMGVQKFTLGGANAYEIATGQLSHKTIATMFRNSAHWSGLAGVLRNHGPEFMGRFFAKLDQGGVDHLNANERVINNQLLEAATILSGTMGIDPGTAMQYMRAYLTGGDRGLEEALQQGMKVEGRDPKTAEQYSKSLSGQSRANDADVQTEFFKTVRRLKDDFVDLSNHSKTMSMAVAKTAPLFTELNKATAGLNAEVHKVVGDLAGLAQDVAARLTGAGASGGGGGAPTVPASPNHPVEAGVEGGALEGAPQYYLTYNTQQHKNDKTNPRAPGIDVAPAKNFRGDVLVKAPVTGRLRFGYDQGGFGFYATIDDGGRRHYLAHLDDGKIDAMVQRGILTAKEGEVLKKQLKQAKDSGEDANFGVIKKIERGQYVGFMGSSGFSTDRHLHYGVKENGTNQWVEDTNLLASYLGLALGKDGYVLRPAPARSSARPTPPTPAKPAPRPQEGASSGDSGGSVGATVVRIELGPQARQMFNAIVDQRINERVKRDAIVS